MVCLKQANKTQPLGLLPAEKGTESKTFRDCYPYCRKMIWGIVLGLGLLFVGGFVFRRVFLFGFGGFYCILCFEFWFNFVLWSSFCWVFVLGMYICVAWGFF